MDEERARTLLQAERATVQELLRQTVEAGRSSRDTADDTAADWADSAEPQTDEEGDDAVAAGLRDRLAALDRAERRLDDGTYGRSIRSGRLIPDERLEADPAAEVTVDEAEQG
jgi:DnaK suppressor protein